MKKRLSETNMQLRYYRIQQLYNELASYHLSVEFIEKTLCEFFTVGPTTIYTAIKMPPIAVRYDNLDLDKQWIANLVKKVQANRNKAAKKQTSKTNTAQTKLNLT